MTISPRPGTTSGFPSPAEDHLETPLDINELIVRHPAATFYLRMDSNAMQRTGIYQGDVLVVDRSLSVQPGMVVVAVVDGDLLVRRYELSLSAPGEFYLVAAHPNYRPLRVRGTMECELWGVVTHAIHCLPGSTWLVGQVSDTSTGGTA